MSDINAGKWEMPGGHIEPEEQPRDAAVREWEEETGLKLPPGEFIGKWDGSNGKYQGFIYEIPSEADLDLRNREEGTNPDGDHFEAIAWVNPLDLHNHNLRHELMDDIGRVQGALVKNSDTSEIKNPKLVSFKSLVDTLPKHSVEQRSRRDRKRMKKHKKGEEIDLAPWEEEALEAAWDHLCKGKDTTENAKRPTSKKPKEPKLPKHQVYQSDVVKTALQHLKSGGITSQGHLLHVMGLPTTHPITYHQVSNAGGPHVMSIVESPRYGMISYINPHDKEAYLASISVKKKGTGLGTDIVSNHLHQLTGLGYKKIGLKAARSAEMTGYRVWPSLGFEGEFNDEEKEKLPSEYKNAKSVQHLFRMPGGKDWWRENGWTKHMYFDLSPNSENHKLLAAYNEEKAKRRPTMNTSDEYDDNDNNDSALEFHEGCELDLAPWEEEALEAAWRRIEQERQNQSPIKNESEQETGDSTSSWKGEPESVKKILIHDTPVTVLTNPTKGSLERWTKRTNGMPLIGVVQGGNIHVSERETPMADPIYHEMLVHNLSEGRETPSLKDRLTIFRDPHTDTLRTESHLGEHNPIISEWAKARGIRVNEDEASVTDNARTEEQLQAMANAARATREAYSATKSLPGEGDSYWEEGQIHLTDPAIAHEAAGVARSRSRIAVFDLAARQHSRAMKAHRRAASSLPEEELRKAHKQAAVKHYLAMRANKAASRLIETVWNSLHSDVNHKGELYSIYKNPTTRQLRSIIKSDPQLSARGLIHPKTGDVYIWGNQEGGLEHKEALNHYLSEELPYDSHKIYLQQFKHSDNPDEIHLSTRGRTGEHITTFAHKHGLVSEGTFAENEEIEPKYPQSSKRAVFHGYTTPIVTNPDRPSLERWLRHLGRNASLIGVVHDGNVHVTEANTEGRHTIYHQDLHEAVGGEGEAELRDRFMIREHRGKPLIQSHWGARKHNPIISEWAKSKGLTANRRKPTDNTWSEEARRRSAETRRLRKKAKPIIVPRTRRIEVEPTPPTPTYHPGSAHGSEVRIEKSNERAWHGDPVNTSSTLTKQETGRVGEAVVLAYLKEHISEDARPMNTKATNFPIDMLEDHKPTEVKAGLASNSRKAQQWRLTFSKESKAEKESYAKMSPDERREYNALKQQRIHERKQKVIKQLEKATGQKVHPRTMTVIINPDTKTADLYEFDGLHDRIDWRSEMTKKAYIGSFKYDHV